MLVINAVDRRALDEMTTAVRIPADAREYPSVFGVPSESDLTGHFLALRYGVGEGTGTPVDVHRWFPYGADDPFWRNYALYADERGPELGLRRNDRLLGSGIVGTATLVAEDAVCQDIRPWPEHYEPLPAVHLANYESILRDMSVHFE